MEQLKQLDALIYCTSCFHPFCPDNEPYCALKTPTKSSSCHHVICHRCLFEHANAGLRSRRYMDCPICFARCAFRVSTSTSCREPEMAWRIKKTLRSNLIEVHRRPWNLSLGVYPFVMERVCRLPSSIQVRSSGSKVKEALIRDRMRRLSVSTLFDMIHGLVQVHNFSTELSYIRTTTTTTTTITTNDVGRYCD